jgi:hypothetical protein
MRRNDYLGGTVTCWEPMRAAGVVVVLLSALWSPTRPALTSWSGSSAARLASIRRSASPPALTGTAPPPCHRPLAACDRRICSVPAQVAVSLILGRWGNGRPRLVGPRGTRSAPEREQICRAAAEELPDAAVT